MKQQVAASIETVVMTVSAEFELATKAQIIGKVCHCGQTRSGCRRPSTCSRRKGHHPLTQTFSRRRGQQSLTSIKKGLGFSLDCGGVKDDHLDPSAMGREPRSPRWISLWVATPSSRSTATTCECHKPGRPTQALGLPSNHSHPRPGTLDFARQPRAA